MVQIYTYIQSPDGPYKNLEFCSKPNNTRSRFFSSLFLVTQNHYDSHLYLILTRKFPYNSLCSTVWWVVWLGVNLLAKGHTSLLLLGHFLRKRLPFPWVVADHASSPQDRSTCSKHQLTLVKVIKWLNSYLSPDNRKSKFEYK